MVNKFSYLMSYAKFKSNPQKNKIRKYPFTYAKKRQLVLQEGNDFIYDLICSDNPCMVARYGSVEMGIIKLRIAQNLHLIKQFDDANMNAICNNAGFFPKEQKMVEKFADLMIMESSNVDFLGCLYSSMEDLVIRNYASQAEIAHLRALEPWYVSVPWTRALKGKKVLVIHPFQDTILSQYEKREKIFSNTDILPNFNLITLKAVQTIAGEKDERFENWFEALDFMYDNAMKIDFDVAIIGCGAYGFPLASMLKKSGKKAIHMGGATQLLFGITGKRWENNEVVQRFLNDSWVFPSESERPKNANRVENGCYW